MVQVYYKVLDGVIFVLLYISFLASIRGFDVGGLCSLGIIYKDCWCYL